jgi:cation:H+ antiporter
MIILHSFIVLLCFVGLYFGASFILYSGEKIGLYFGLSHLVIGLLIVGFGTSLPELFVSQIASSQKHYEFAIGNILGSNIANILLVMGVTGLISSLQMQRKDVLYQFVFHLIVTIILIGLFLLGRINLITTSVLTIVFLFYLKNTFNQMKMESKIGHHTIFEPDDLKENPIDKIHQVPSHFVVESITVLDYIKLLVGFLLLYFSGKYLVSSGFSLGVLIGIETYVLSAILIALGTSAPELATGIITCLKKKDVDIITGNVIGSNIFNIAFILSSLGVYDFKLSRNYFFELTVLIICSVFLLVLSLLKINFSKLQGMIFILGYFSVVFYWISIGFS